MSGKKRSTFNLKFKLDAIEFAEKSSNTKAAQQFGVNLPQISRWKKDKALISSNVNKNKKVCKRVRAAKWPQLENNIKGWIIEQRQKSIQVSGATILMDARKNA